jgi:KipI family sensor histidine kinase inhibitor
MPPAVLQLGERAFLIREADRATVATATRAAALAAALRAEQIPAVLEVVAAGASVAVHIDPFAPEAGKVEQRLRIVAAHLDEVPALSEARTHHIPVRYDGPDLADVAARTGLSIADVIARHTAVEYHVLALGFAPGFAYLGELDPALRLPRHDTPRPRVPAGSVAIAGAQTAVYPSTTPGGWHLIGSTATRLFDAARAPAALLSAGDRVRFVPAT